MTPAEAFADLIERLEKAADVLGKMAADKQEWGNLDYERLRGKAEGVRLALDYVRQYSVQSVTFEGGDS